MPRLPSSSVAPVAIATAPCANATGTTTSRAGSINSVVSETMPARLRSGARRRRVPHFYALVNAVPAGTADVPWREAAAAIT